MAPTDPLEEGLPAPPPTAPPDAVRAAIKARVLAASLGGPAPSPMLGGRYRLIKEIGRGGSGTVWQAELEPLRKAVAIKLLRASKGTEGGQRLLREAMSASKIGHPHIVNVHDVGTDDHGAPYLVMDLLEGESLASLPALPWAEVQVIAEQICAGLHAAHEAGVVHRDIKPANVFVRRDGEGRWHSTLLDFGLCRAIQADAALTEEGTLLGTPGYMAPEQIRGDPADRRADLYGVACVVVELLSGAPAFSGTRQQILAAQLEGNHAPVPTDLPARARAAVQAALSLDPDDRPATAAELRTALLATSLDRTVPAAAPPDRAAARGYVLGVVTTVAFIAGIVLVQASNDSPPESVDPRARRPRADRPIPAGPRRPAAAQADAPRAPARGSRPHAPTGRGRTDAPGRPPARARAPPPQQAPPHPPAAQAGHQARPAPEARTRRRDQRSVLTLAGC